MPMLDAHPDRPLKIDRIFDMKSIKGVFAFQRPFFSAAVNSYPMIGSTELLLWGVSRIEIILRTDTM